MGRNLSTDLSRPFIQPSKVSPLLEMIKAGLCFRIQWILWKLSGIDLLAIAEQYKRYRSLSIEILFTSGFEVLLIIKVIRFDPLAPVKTTALPAE